MFDHIRPDEVAECWEGVTSVPGLYKALWNSMSDMQPLSELIDIEESSPGDAVGFNTLASVWQKFSPEHQAALTRLAAENDYA
jgi:hypothetical protein